MSSRLLRGLVGLDGDGKILCGFWSTRRILVDYDHGLDKAWQMLVDWASDIFSEPKTGRLIHHHKFRL